jgi:hypothetical protein
MQLALDTAPTKGQTSIAFTDVRLIGLALRVDVFAAAEETDDV